MTDAIPPHGGTLVDRSVPEKERQRLDDAAARMPVHQLDRRALSDLEMLVIGAFSPLEGFMDALQHETGSASRSSTGPHD